MDRNISRTFSGRQTLRNYNLTRKAPREIQPRRYKYFEISCCNVRGAPAAGDKQGSRELCDTHTENNANKL